MSKDDALFVYEVRCSKTEASDTRISFAGFTVEVYAVDEAEVRQIMAEEEPDMAIDSIKLIGPA